jgi:peptide deformylase
MIRKVALMGHPVLRQVAAPVSPADITTPDIQTLIDDMLETMNEYHGRGLAAPQIRESLQIFVMVWDFEPGKAPYDQVLINPVIKSLTKQTSTFWEGCLSLPQLIGKVSRPNRVHVEALDRKGNKLSFIAEDFAATVVQHENDHLQGILYIDRMENLKELAFTHEYKRHMAGGSDEDGVEE